MRNRRAQGMGHTHTRTHTHTHTNTARPIDLRCRTQETRSQKRKRDLDKTSCQPEPTSHRPPHCKLDTNKRMLSLSLLLSELCQSRLSSLCELQTLPVCALYVFVCLSRLKDLYRCLVRRQLDRFQRCTVYRWRHSPPNTSPRHCSR
jgi:hypothetical protein